MAACSSWRRTRTNRFSSASSSAESSRVTSDEFFMVRVAGLIDQVVSGVSVRSRDGRTSQNLCLDQVGDLVEEELRPLGPERRVAHTTILTFDGAAVKAARHTWGERARRRQTTDATPSRSTTTFS